MSFAKRQLSLDPDCRGRGLDFRRRSITRRWASRGLAAQGKTLEQCKAEQAGKSGAAKAAPFILVFVGELIMAFVLYGILIHMGTFTLRAGHHFRRVLLVRLRAAHRDGQQRLWRPQADADGHRQRAHWLGALVIIGAILGWMGR